jgi:hypothetical protein
MYKITLHYLLYLYAEVVVIAAAFIHGPGYEQTALTISPETADISYFITLITYNSTIP